MILLKYSITQILKYSITQLLKYSKQVEFHCQVGREFTAITSQAQGIAPGLCFWAFSPNDERGLPPDACVILPDDHTRPAVDIGLRAVLYATKEVEETLGDRAGLVAEDIALAGLYIIDA